MAISNVAPLSMLAWPCRGGHGHHRGSRRHTALGDLVGLFIVDAGVALAVTAMVVAGTVVGAALGDLVGSTIVDAGVALAVAAMVVAGAVVGTALGDLDGGTIVDAGVALAVAAAMVIAGAVGTALGDLDGGTIVDAGVALAVTAAVVARTVVRTTLGEHLRCHRRLGHGRAVRADGSLSGGGEQAGGEAARVSLIGDTAGIEGLVVRAQVAGTVPSIRARKKMI
ncbi:MAG: hypothetical protein U1E17_09390 [Geminicoccaceae bacterium]